MEAIMEDQSETFSETEIKVISVFTSDSLDYVFTCSKSSRMTNLVIRGSGRNLSYCSSSSSCTSQFLSCKTAVTLLRSSWIATQSEHMVVDVHSEVIHRQWETVLSDSGIIRKIDFFSHRKKKNCCQFQVSWRTCCRSYRSDDSRYKLTTRPLKRKTCSSKTGTLTGLSWEEDMTEEEEKWSSHWYRSIAKYWGWTRQKIEHCWRRGHYLTKRAVGRKSHTDVDEIHVTRLIQRLSLKLRWNSQIFEDLVSIPYQMISKKYEWTTGIETPL